MTKHRLKIKEVLHHCIVNLNSSLNKTADCQDLNTHLLSLERSYATVIEKQNGDLATLGRRTGAIETLVGQLREAAEATNLPQDEGKGGERRPGWLGRLLRNHCCCCC